MVRPRKTTEISTSPWERTQIFDRADAKTCRGERSNWQIRPFFMRRGAAEQHGKLWWNIIAFPGKSLPHAWLSGLVVSVASGLSWLLHRQHPTAIVLWAMVTTTFDMVLGLVALTEFSTTLQSNAPALLPPIGIELIAYWNRIGYWIAVSSCTIALITLWPFPSYPLSSIAISHMAFWLAVNFLLLSGVATLVSLAAEASPAQWKTCLVSFFAVFSKVWASRAISRCRVCSFFLSKALEW